ncbi:hypothetical protein [Puniceicoccus vermicola]|uniref:Uncharacterized protein n=1 Tax=Puniceicoccus vermicola TaxID=388746 RepID=A0A7X1B2E7_9BACT|nr:hypothetical protein [Puniceicoccus vermicola]MBC2603165.1 hypothetical protein [Puniceicoccus vermicola]
MEATKITGIDTNCVTEPRNDGTPGSALYTVPLKLNKTPSQLWAKIFVHTWNSPPQYTSMHRPGIASVRGDRIILNGTTLDEVDKTHKATLKLCIEEADKKEQETIRRHEEARRIEKEKSDQWRRETKERADGISFD